MHRGTVNRRPFVSRQKPRRDATVFSPPSKYRRHFNPRLLNIAGIIRGSRTGNGHSEQCRMYLFFSRASPVTSRVSHVLPAMVDARVIIHPSRIRRCAFRALKLRGAA